MIEIAHSPLRQAIAELLKRQGLFFDAEPRRNDRAHRPIEVSDYAIEIYPEHKWLGLGIHRAAPFP